MQRLARGKYPKRASCHHHPVARGEVGAPLIPGWDYGYFWPILSPHLCPSQVVLPSYEEAVSLPPKTPEGDPAPPPYSEV